MKTTVLPKLIELGRLCLQLGRVNRATFHEDGVRPETDTDHTVMLGVVACAFAEAYAPHLDRGLIAQFALVHDFVEVHAGDTVTLGLDKRGATEKVAREAAALKKLSSEFRDSLPWLPAQIEAYERLDTPEARFVKVLDKVMPPITHLLNKGATLRKHGIDSENLRDLHRAQHVNLISTCGYQPEAIKLLTEMHELLAEAAS